jgi:hypothetical protein
MVAGDAPTRMSLFEDGVLCSGKFNRFYARRKSFLAG